MLMSFFSPGNTYSALLRATMTMSAYDDDCHGLAATLSANYRNTEPFDLKISTVKDYLSTHGVLLSMCLASSTCFQPMGFTQQHLSASWVNADIGFKILPAPSQLGLIFKPEAVEMATCMFPTDAATDARDDHGCGPMMTDPEYGSQGASRIPPAVKEKYGKMFDAYKEFNFPGMEYSDIECMQFLNPLSRFTGIETILWSMTSCDNQTVALDTIYPMTKHMLEASVGHTLCSWDNDGPPPITASKAVVIGMGHNASYPIEDWARVVQLQQRIQSQLAAGEGVAIWNEIVIEAPKHLQDVVAAVFYLSDDAHETALKQSKWLGNVPVLKVDPSRGDNNNNSNHVPLFTCARSRYTSVHAASRSAVTTTYQHQREELTKFLRNGALPL